MKIAIIFAALLGVAVATPYVSFTEFWYSGCNATTSNYVTSVFVYPGDGSCFNPSSSAGELSTSYGYKLTANTTYVTLESFYNEDCSGTAYSPDYYPIDACDSYTVASVWEELPDSDYWTGLEIVGSGGYVWETILQVDYFSAAACAETSWTDTEIQGWETCNSGAYYYCDDEEIHYESCTDITDCASGCYETYDPLSTDCTASTSAPAFWSIYINTGNSASYQATCLGGSSSSSTLAASVAVVVAALALAF